MAMQLKHNFLSNIDDLCRCTLSLWKFDIKREDPIVKKPMSKEIFRSVSLYTLPGNMEPFKPNTAQDVHINQFQNQPS